MYKFLGFIDLAAIKKADWTLETRTFTKTEYFPLPIFLKVSDFTTSDEILSSLQINFDMSCFKYVMDQ